MRAVAIAGATAVAVLGILSAASGAEGPQALTQRQALHRCQQAVRDQLQHPSSADFGVYTVTHPRRIDDWLLEGNLTATSVRGRVAVAHFRCNVQPFNGATVAEVVDR